MFQKKSFTLQHSAPTPNEERNIKRLQWLKRGIYIVAITFFLLILILPNVNFKRKNETAVKVVVSTDNFTILPTINEDDSTNEDADQSKTASTKPEEMNFLVKSLPSSKLESTAISEPTACVFNESPCIVYCANGSIEEVYKFLNEHTNSCLEAVNLTFHKIELIKASGLNNSMRLQRLTMIDCDLTALPNAYFEAILYENLETLQMNYCKFKSFGNNYFEGLNSLKYLAIWKAEIMYANFNHLLFLESFKASLQGMAMSFQQATTMVYYPEFWFPTSANYENFKHLNLSGNNFYDSLSRNSFASFVAIEQLDLSHCNITYLQTDTFSTIERTLRFLDLSYNKLTTVTGLENNVYPKSKGLTVNLEGNPWQCSCNNVEFVRLITETNTILNDSVDCKSKMQTKECSTAITVRDIKLPTTPACPKSNNECNTVIIACTQPHRVNNWQEMEVQAAYNSFSINQIKKFKVRVTILGDVAEDLLLFVKFLPYIEVHHIVSNEFRNKSHVEVSLTSFGDYLFFIAKKHDSSISPFNFKPYHESRITPTEIWMRNKDKGWLCVTVSIAFILAFVIPFGIAHYVRYRRRRNLKDYERVHRNSDQSNTTVEKNKALDEYMPGLYEKYNKIRLSIERAAPYQLAPPLPYKQSYGIRSLTEDNAYSITQNFLNNSLYEDYYEQLQ